MKVAWIGEQPRPLCDVPWVGTVAVLSDGNVNFCCYSSAIVGNVNRTPFLEIWNSADMQRIRRELTEGRFPLECQSMSCPIYRGDAAYAIRPANGGVDHEQIFRGAIQQTDDGQVVLEVAYQGEPAKADIFVSVRLADGSLRFVPGNESYALPLAREIELREDASPLRIALFDQTVVGELCVGIFAAGSDPTRIENCYWAETRTIEGPA